MSRPKSAESKRRPDERDRAPAQGAGHDPAELKQRLNHLEVLYRLIDTVNRAGVVEQVCEQALDGLQRALDADRAAVLLVDRIGALRLRSYRGFSDAELQATEEGAPWLRTEPPVGSIVTVDVESDQTLGHVRESLRRHGTRTLVFIPLVYRDRVLGRFVLHYDRPYLLTDDERELVRSVASHVAFAAERAWSAEALLSSREQLRLLSAHLQSVREEERTSLARELHDELGQALTSLKLDLANLMAGLTELGASEAGSLREVCEAMASRIDETIGRVRRISMDLRPWALDHLGLAAAIDWLARDFEARTKIRCTVTSTLDDVAVERNAATAMFRICQETLTNVARHAGATDVVVALDREDGHVRLEVQDNGRGITPQELTRPTALGLLGMKERALLLGGEFAVTSAPAGGTIVTVKVPLPDRA